MTYQSIDALQSALASDVFHYAKDAKKASGRALGTLLELFTYYMLIDWQFSDSIRIEKSLSEYMNPDIKHNVEYTLHPIISKYKVDMILQTPLTSTKILKELNQIYGDNFGKFEKVNNTLFSTDSVLKNSCAIAKSDDSVLVAQLDSIIGSNVKIRIVEQLENPYAMIECKRVGVEDGMKKGPQTIEKAKQGAYVARMVSNLQKFRNADGEIYGIYPKENMKFEYGEYNKLHENLIQSKTLNEYRDFMVSIGVISNHGNWFTANNMNKELKVLADAYDWLLFLTDEGLATFIDELLLAPAKEFDPIRKAFLSSYTASEDGTGKAASNKFTKVSLDYDVSLLLKKYFSANRQKIESWFNVITPSSGSFGKLRTQLETLSAKRWI